jgi:tetratricopeptide (TPR) repeat protein
LRKKTYQQAAAMIKNTPNQNTTDKLITLDKPIADKTLELCQLGYKQFDQGEFKTALRHFYSAWTLLPKPQSQWEQAGWILTALGDAYFAKGEYDNASEALRSALHCPKALGNPIIHLRLGQCLYELNDSSSALQQFELVCSHGGEDLFQQELPKYYQFLSQHQNSHSSNPG